MYSQGIGVELSDFPGRMLGLLCQYQLCQPEAFAFRVSSCSPFRVGFCVFVEPSSCVEFAECVGARVVEQEPGKTQLAFSTAVTGFTHPKSSK